MNVLPDFPEPIAPKTTILHSAGSCSGTVLQVLAFPNIIDILSRTAVWKKSLHALSAPCQLLLDALVRIFGDVLLEKQLHPLCFSSGWHFFKKSKSHMLCRFSWKRLVVETNHIWQGWELESLRRTALKSSAALVCVDWSLPALDHLETAPPKGRKQSRVTVCLTQNNHVKVMFLEGENLCF